jgi:hypothetical protein
MYQRVEVTRDNFSVDFTIGDHAKVSNSITFDKRYFINTAH